MLVGIRIITLVVVSVFINPGEVFAQYKGANDDEVSATDISVKEPLEVDKKKGIFDEMGFGVGLSFTLDTGENSRIKSAELVNGIVRVTDEENGIPRLVLELHNFYWDKGNWGYGPFVAVQAGDEEIINAVAVGVMMGLKYGNKESNGRSFNVGVGIVADPNVQIFGDGILENQPLPAGETEIRFKEETQYGVMLMFSSSW